MPTTDGGAGAFIDQRMDMKGTWRIWGSDMYSKCAAQMESDGTCIFIGMAPVILCGGLIFMITETPTSCGDEHPAGRL
jgi:hypothetical protein